MGMKCPFLLTQTALYTYDILDCITTDCRMWDSINSRCGIKTSDIQIHRHASHEHMLSHTCAGSKYSDQYLNNCGTIASVNTMPLASKLINEFLFNEDMDGNTKVYGYDFMISNSDPDKPIVLKSIESHADWLDPTCQITWDMYKEWLIYGSDTSSDPYFIGFCT